MPNYLECFLIFASGAMIGGGFIGHHMSKLLDADEYRYIRLYHAARALHINVKSFTDNPTTMVSGAMVGLSLAPDLSNLKAALED